MATFFKLKGRLEAAVAGASDAASRIGDALTHGGSMVMSGVKDVLWESMPASALFDITMCPEHGPGVATEVVATVLVGGRPALRRGGKCSCLLGGAALPIPLLLGPRVALHPDLIPRLKAFFNAENLEEVFEGAVESALERMTGEDVTVDFESNTSLSELRSTQKGSIRIGDDFEATFEVDRDLFYGKTDGRDWNLDGVNDSRSASGGLFKGTGQVQVTQGGKSWTFDVEGSLLSGGGNYTNYTDLATGGRGGALNAFFSVLGLQVKGTGTEQTPLGPVSVTGGVRGGALGGGLDLVGGANYVPQTGAAGGGLLADAGVYGLQGGIFGGGEVPLPGTQCRVAGLADVSASLGDLGLPAAGGVQVTYDPETGTTTIRGKAAGHEALAGAAVAGQIVVTCDAPPGTKQHADQMANALKALGVTQPGNNPVQPVPSPVVLGGK
ncbi:MAG TPA: PAAR domain-containing protein [Acidimicrobiia bacterium]|nr:PAAR domain-containing protein [Acidimicrobiia bacterium]